MPQTHKLFNYFAKDTALNSATFTGFWNLICLYYFPLFSALQVGGLKHAFKYYYLWFPEMLKLPVHYIGTMSV